MATESMLDDDVRAAAALLADGFSGTADIVRGVHTAVAGRVFSLTGTPGAPARMVHDVISDVVHSGVRSTGRLALLAAGYAAARRTGPASGRLVDHPAASVAVGAVNGAFGDRLARHGSSLSLPMTLRVEARDVGMSRTGLAAAYPGATGDVVVFVHGLCETDAAWRLGAQRHYGDPTSTHGSRLAAEGGCTPVYVRYNTGRHISDSGSTLSELLTALVQHWPVTVRRLTLVGHSMGGLVARSACCAGRDAGAPWLAPLQSVVYLGSPHLGAPLELAATAAGCALRTLPETRPFATALAARSAGIKDLRYGAVLADDWADIDLDVWQREPATVAPLLDTAVHYYIGATVTDRHDSIAGRVLGDLLVPFPSASGRGKRRGLAFPVDAGHHLGRLHHLDLLNHPRVYARLRDWLLA